MIAPYTTLLREMNVHISRYRCGSQTHHVRDTDFFALCRCRSHFITDVSATGDDAWMMWFKLAGSLRTRSCNVLLSLCGQGS